MDLWTWWFFCCHRYTESRHQCTPHEHPGNIGWRRLLFQIDDHKLKCSKRTSTTWYTYSMSLCIGVRIYIYIRVMVEVHQQLNGCHTQFEHYPVFTKFGSHLSIDFSPESGMQFSFFVYHATYVNLGLSCGKDNQVREVKYLATWLMWLRFWVATTWHKPFTVALWFVEKTWKHWKPFSQLKQNKLRDSRCSWSYCLLPSVWCGLSEFSNDWTSGRYDGCWCFRNAATKTRGFSEIALKIHKVADRFQRSQLSTTMNCWLLISLGCHGVTFPAPPETMDLQNDGLENFAISWSHQIYRDRLSWHRSTGDARRCDGCTRLYNPSSNQ